MRVLGMGGRRLLNDLCLRFSRGLGAAGPRRGQVERRGLAPEGIDAGRVGGWYPREVLEALASRNQASAQLLNRQTWASRLGSLTGGLAAAGNRRLGQVAGRVRRHRPKLAEVLEPSRRHRPKWAEVPGIVCKCGRWERLSSGSQVRTEAESLQRFGCQSSKQARMKQEGSDKQVGPPPAKQAFSLMFPAALGFFFKLLD